MNTKEKHILENESKEKREERIRREDDPNARLTAESLTAAGKNRKRGNSSLVGRIWLWLGVIVLIFILLYWLFAIGTLGDIMDWFNG